MKISSTQGVLLSGTTTMIMAETTVPDECVAVLVNIITSGTVCLLLHETHETNGFEVTSGYGLIMPEPTHLYSFLPTQISISSYMETPWIHLPRSIGIKNWARTRTEALWIRIYAGGEDADNAGYITLTTAVMLDLDRDTVVATYSTTHNAAAWPTDTCEPKMIQSVAGDHGTFEWIKLRISNNGMERFNLYKINFGFSVRPMVEGA